MARHLPPCRKQRGSLLAFFVLALLPGACRRGGPVPGPDLSPEAVETLRSRFAVGVAALEVGEPGSRALESFRQVTELAPQEPAGWANLAIVHLGPGGDAAAARAAIDRALALPPVAGEVAFVAALVAEREGDAAAAQAALEQAVAAEGDKLRARYRLFQTLAASDPAAARAQLQAIVAAAPDNRLGRMELARVLAEGGDAAAAAEQMAPLWRDEERWGQRLRDQAVKAKAALKDGDAAASKTALTVLANLLVEDPAFMADAARLRSPANPAEQPLRRLLTLPEEAPAVAPPDTALRFRPEPITQEGARWALAAQLADEGPPTVLVARAEGLRLLGEPPQDLAYPAGDPPLAPEGVLAADLDNDRRPDLVLAGPRGLRIYRQGEGSSFGAQQAPAGLDVATLDVATLDGPWTAVWAFDLELDGDLDLALGTAEGPPPVLRNNGDGSWQRQEPLALEGLSRLVWADGDGDGDNDLLARDGAGRLIRLDNERFGRYSASPAPEAPGALDLAAVDLADGAAGRLPDGILDLVLLAGDAGGPRLDKVFPYGGPNGAWQAGESLLTPSALDQLDAGLGALILGGMDEAGAAERAASRARLLSGDLDNNGSVDLIIGGLGTPRSPVLDQGGAALAQVEASVLALADLDEDGRLDLLGVDASGRPLRLMNEGGAQDYHWQRVRPRGLEIPAAPSGAAAAAGSADQRINSFGIGGQITLRAGSLTQTVPIASGVVHLGLGTRTAADLLYIEWPNGVAQAEFEQAADAETVALQRLKGSCPWLFAEGADGMAFVTDILWRSPLGLRINAVDTAGVVQTEDWVNLAPEQLTARDGRYHLAITAELWESHFFDRVALKVVDHPTGLLPLVDERFAIPPPPLALQPLGPLLPLSAAQDQDGRDAGAAIAEEDGRYLDGFALGDYQGIARPHWLELDLSADLARLAAQEVRAEAELRPVLVAGGWIYPTDSSINVAIGQGKRAAPQALQLQVPDGTGGWKDAGPPQGFPAGKRKTLLLDLAGLGPAGGLPSRLRLSTNLEVYWDRLALAARRPEAGLLVQDLTAETAELRYRGFSVTSHFGSAGPAPRSAPELPDYERLSALHPQWIDLGGFYTRFGAVDELLAKTDDRYAILNAGDEIRLSFVAPPPPPPGWTRRFVFVSDGWEKDGDFNTAYGGTVLPLPSHDQPGYADPVVSGPVGALEDDPIYQRYPADWQDYHTRYLPPQRRPRPLYRGRP